MAKHQLSPEAKDDLAEIFAYIALDNESPAARLIERFLDMFRRLAQFPGMGRERPEIGENFRSIPEGNYLIVYRMWAGNVVMVRVFHTARDIDNIFS